MNTAQPTIPRALVAEFRNVQHAGTKDSAPPVVVNTTVIGRLTIEEMRTADGATLVRLTMDGQSSTYTIDRLELELEAVLHMEVEGTVVVPVDWLPMGGRDWLRYPDMPDVVAVNSRLDDAGRRLALAEALAEAGVR